MPSTISSDPKIARYYQDLPEESIERLHTFRERLPYKTAVINDRTWHYIDSGEGERAVFIPSGGTMIAEVSFQSLEHFSRRYRVISPDYPPIDNLDELFTGFIELLDHLGIDECYTMGGSYGGWIVQSLVRAYPKRVKKVVITSVGPPNPENSQQLAKMMPLLKIMPMFLFRALINRSFANLESGSSQNPDMALMWALVKEIMHHRVTKRDFITGMQRLIDQTKNYTFTPQDLDDWEGEMLYVCGSEDPATTPEKREGMRQLYPRARFKVFEGGEHGIAITHQEEYFAVIDSFLAA